jgi:hypothetical protein
MPLIGRSVAEEGQDCCNARGHSGAAGIGESQKFDQVIVDWRRSRLHEEDLLATHRTKQLHGNVAVRIPIDDAGTKVSAQFARDPCRQCRIGIACKIVNPLFTLPPAARGAMGSAA